MKPVDLRARDHDVEQVVSRLLQVGVLLAAVVVFVGGLLMLMHHGGEARSYAVFRGEPAHLTSIGGIVRGIAAGESASIVQLGLVLLVATPVARVAFTLIAFAIQRDATYVAITTIVLALLLFSLLFS